MHTRNNEYQRQAEPAGIARSKPDRSAGLRADGARLADLVMLSTLFASAVAALAIGHQFGQLPLALGAGSVLLVVGGLAYLAWRGRPMAGLVLTTCNVAFVALHIQLGRGTIEFHFGVFVLLGLLLVYRDWRPLLLGAALFAVHHILFDRLQALDWGVYCTPEPNFLKVLMHALYLVVQTGIEVFLAIRLQQAAQESAELSALVRAIDRGDTLCLDVSGVPVASPVALILQGAMAKMAVAMTDVNHAAASIETACTEIAAGNLDLSQRTEEQASNLQQTAASMDQLTGAVKVTADTAVQATRLASSASAAAAEGGTAVTTVIAMMDDISRSSRRIADINAVVDGIAFQTNILALNAAVEAARAGEQGRGFAVVATEVRLLAQRSAAAAREIKSLIGESVDKVERGSAQVGVAGTSVDSVVGQARHVSELMNEISAAAVAQMGGIHRVGEAVTQLDAVTQQNAALVEQSAAAAESLKHQAMRLNAVVRRFAVDGSLAMA